MGQGIFRQLSVHARYSYKEMAVFTGSKSQSIWMVLCTQACYAFVDVSKYIYARVNHHITTTITTTTAILIILVILIVFISLSMYLH